MEENTNLAASVLEEYYQFISGLGDQMPEVFLSYKSVSHMIDLKEYEQSL
jgi:hypothetical protein